MTQVKEPKTLHFQALTDALKQPGDFLVSDFAKMDRPPILHVAFQALDTFQVICCCCSIARCKWLDFKRFIQNCARPESFNSLLRRCHSCQEQKSTVLVNAAPAVNGHAGGALEAAQALQYPGR